MTNPAKIAKAILEEYQPENTSDMTSALKDIFGSMFEAMLQGEMERILDMPAMTMAKKKLQTDEMDILLKKSIPLLEMSKLKFQEIVIQSLSQR